MLCGDLEGWDGGKGGCSRGSGYMFNYGWFILSYGRNHYNIVKQFSSNNRKESIYHNNMGEKNISDEPGPKGPPSSGPD